MTVAIAVGLALLASPQWPEKEWAFKGVESGVTSQIKEAGVFVMRNDSELRAYMNRRGDIRRPLPKIDWKINQVVAVHVGSRPTAGYEVQVKHVWKKPGGASIEYDVVAPGPGAVLAQVVTYPFSMVRTEKFPGRVWPD